jgi:hypothetical protein
MTRKHFEAILSHLRIWTAGTPDFCDHFFQLHEFFSAWHEIQSQKLLRRIPLGCDNSHVPGFVHNSKKPIDKGNECRTLACSASQIIFSFEPVEGKDASPPQSPILTLNLEPQLG